MLILSEYAGAYEELGAFALGVNPFDIEEQAEAIHRALTMPRRGARVRGRRCCAAWWRSNSIEKWVEAQFADIAAKLAGGA